MTPFFFFFIEGMHVCETCLGKNGGTPPQRRHMSPWSTLYRCKFTPKSMKWWTESTPSLSGKISTVKLKVNLFISTMGIQCWDLPNHMTEICETMTFVWNYRYQTWIIYTHWRKLNESIVEYLFGKKRSFPLTPNNFIFYFGMTLLLLKSFE